MAWLYKILRVVSSQKPVSKHAASVCLQACLSLRPQCAHITQGKSSSIQQYKDEILIQSRRALRHFVRTSCFYQAWTQFSETFKLKRLYSLMVLGILKIKLR